jgi:hypothetical protein
MFQQIKKNVTFDFTLEDVNSDEDIGVNVEEKGKKEPEPLTRDDRWRATVNSNRDWDKGKHCKLLYILYSAGFKSYQFCNNHFGISQLCKAPDAILCSL